MTDLIAVTGATGTLGSLVVDQLLTRVPAERVVAIGRNPAKTAALEGRAGQVRVADHDDRPAVDAALRGVDVLLLVSGNEFGRRMTQHENVIRAAQQAGVSRIVYTSAPHADTSQTFIAAEHRATEALIRASGLTFTMLRMNSYHENYAPLLTSAAQTGEVIGSVRNGRVASADHLDFAAASAVVLTTGGHDDVAYELTGDTAWPYPELAAALAEVTGRPVVYRDLSPQEHAEALRARGVDEQTISFLVQLDADLAAGVSADATGDLRWLIGRPTIPLVDGLRAIAARG